jgi:alkanesulfonate monooxygenase SsuD/methylene tetrahydromethanopterin reductase-like flavin-dependent oxidoreductase (luciferase family)
MAYFGMPKAGHKVEDVLRVGEPAMSSRGSPILAATTTRQEISVFPQPVQKPHPQVGEPGTSARSSRWAAQHKVHAFTVPAPPSRLKRNLDIYYEEADKHGWPDRLQRGRWKFGWDAEKHRGFGCCRYVHILPNGKGHPQALPRYKEALELQWDYYGPFGFAAVLSDIGEPMSDLHMKITADLIMQQEIAIVGTVEQVVEKILHIQQTCNYEDFLCTAWFEAGGYHTAVRPAVVVHHHPASSPVPSGRALPRSP